MVRVHIDGEYGGEGTTGEDVGRCPIMSGMTGTGAGDKRGRPRKGRNRGWVVSKYTPLIRLHEHAFAVQPDAVRVLVFSVYDFSECHKFHLTDPSSSLR